MATLDELWEDLLAVALVGTDRRPPVPLPAGEGPGRLLAGLRRTDPAHTWLASAGALTILRLAGGRPAHLPLAAEAPCADDEWPRCRPAAALHLAQMLAGQFESALPEWLATAAARWQRVPEEHLPELLDWGHAHPELRAVLVRVIGQRGAWLACQNERWAYAAPHTQPLVDASLDERLEVWELAEPAGRLALLEHARAADPPSGLALLRHTWAQEKHDDRLAFLKILSTGLSLADEPFLEEVLSERSVTLRQAASRLLARLPESRQSQRMRALARPLLRLEGGPRGVRKRGALAGPSLRLMVNLPETNAADLPRTDPRPATPPKETDRARWLANMLSAVPPADWCHLLNQSPSELVILARANILDFALIEGWAAATAAFGDTDWAEALLRERLAELDTAALQPLLRTLPAARREALVFAALKGVERLAQRHPALRLLQAYTEPWSARLTRLFVDKLRAEITRRDVPFGPTVELGWLTSVALYWHPALAEEFAPVLLEARHAASQGGGWFHWLHTVEQAVALWQFRHVMLKELVP